MSLTYGSCSVLFDESCLFLASPFTHLSPLYTPFSFHSETPVEEQPTQKEEPLEEDEDEQEVDDEEEEYHYDYEDEDMDKEEEEEKTESSKTTESQDEEKTLQEVKGVFSFFCADILKKKETFFYSWPVFLKWWIVTQLKIGQSTGSYSWSTAGLHILHFKFKSLLLKILKFVSCAVLINLQSKS